MMDTWESFFVEKSRRRSSGQALEIAIKSIIVFLLLSGIGAVIYLGFIAPPQ